MPEASSEPSLELVRPVLDWEWNLGIDAALLHDEFYTGARLAIPVSPSELDAHRGALRYFVETEDVATDGLTVLTAVQLKLERAFDDESAQEQAVELDVTEVLVLAIAQLRFAKYHLLRRNHSKSTLHRLLGGRLLDRVDESNRFPDIFGDRGKAELVPGGSPFAM